MNDYVNHVPRSTVSRSVARTRLLVGLLQGLALYLIYQAAENKLWTAGNSGLYSALLMVLIIAPVLLVSGLGHMPAKTLWRWLLPAAAVLALLGYYDIWRGVGAPYWDSVQTADAARFPSPELWVHTVAGFLIAHTLVSAAAIDGRRIAGYRVYFESASKLLIQFAFAGVFVAIIWLVLNLGAELFKLIKLDFIKKLLDESWFVIPAITSAFAYALHITDVHPAIVRGIRSLVLVLLSWILPIAVLLIGGFLLALPFTGLEPLWATKTATALLLAASAVLAVLLNAAFQDGSVTHDVAAPIRFSARIAALILLPLTLIAAYALSLRVSQYGWTVDRLVAAFCLVVAICCAMGYFWAAIRSPTWLSKVASVNVFVAFILLFLLLAIFSPLLDPARISANSQLAHLQAGKVSAEKFDYDYLRFSGKRFGTAALQRLAEQKTGKDAALIQQKASSALAKTDQWKSTPPARNELLANITVWPKGRTLPETFIKQDWSKHKETWQLPDCLSNSTSMCNAVFIDIDGDGSDEMLFDSHDVLFRQTGNAWVRVGTVKGLAGCGDAFKQLQQGQYALVASMLRDVQIAGRRFSVHADRSEDDNTPVCAKKSADVDFQGD